MWSGLKWHGTGSRKGLCRCYDGRSICITTDFLRSWVTVSCLRTLLVLYLSLSSYLVTSALSFFSNPINSNSQNQVSLRNVWLWLSGFNPTLFEVFPAFRHALQSPSSGSIVVAIYTRCENLRKGNH